MTSVLIVCLDFCLADILGPISISNNLTEAGGTRTNNILRERNKIGYHVGNRKQNFSSYVIHENPNLEKSKLDVIMGPLRSIPDK